VSEPVSDETLRQIAGRRAIAEDAEDMARELLAARAVVDAARKTLRTDDLQWVLAALERFDRATEGEKL